MILSYGTYTPHIHDSVFIAENASIIGSVDIGEDSSVWFGSVLRGDIAPIKIGKRSNIQDLTMIHVARASGVGMTVGDDVTVGHSVVLHACRIDNACLIGMGSVILDDVIIGRESIVGAGSLLTKGNVFPERSMILGSPAKAVRTLSSDEIEAIYNSAVIYVDLKRTYQ